MALWWAIHMAQTGQSNNLSPVDQGPDTATIVTIVFIVWILFFDDEPKKRK